MLDHGTSRFISDVTVLNHVLDCKVVWRGVWGPWGLFLILIFLNFKVRLRHTWTQQNPK